MKSFTYNDMDFSVEKVQGRWDISCKKPDGTSALVGAGLFAGLPEDEVGDRARALVKSILPVGIKIVGPDVTHPNLIGDMKLVGPDVTHPNFIYWDKDSSSFPKQAG
ncbi:MAG: hypothetical protein NTV11_16480 [Rhodocyclales bacterium]|nr:hypothetical protein [Rhodocyclales bacterium]